MFEAIISTTPAAYRRPRRRVKCQVAIRGHSLPIPVWRDDRGGTVSR